MRRRWRAAVLSGALIGGLLSTGSTRGTEFAVVAAVMDQDCFDYHTVAVRFSATTPEPAQFTWDLDDDGTWDTPRTHRWTVTGYYEEESYYTVAVAAKSRTREQAFNTLDFGSRACA